MKRRTKTLLSTLVVLFAFGLGVWGSLSLQEKIQGQSTTPASHKLETNPKPTTFTIEC